VPTLPPPCRRAALGLAAILLALTAACDTGAPATTAPIGGTPTATAALAPATIAPTDTAAPPTETSAPPTETSAPPTETSAPPTDTAPPATDTAPPATAVAVPPTVTAAPRPPTADPPTRRPATAIPPTRVPPTAAPTEAATTPEATTEATGTAGATRPTAAPDPSRIPGDMSQVERVPAGKHRIALTFDAGSTRGRTDEILADLAKYHAHITFFITGQWAEQNPDQLRAIVAAGHEVANHSYSHPSFPTLTDAQMIAELQKCESIIQATAGVSSKPYWRPPFGDETGHTLDVAAAQGYRSIYWTWDSLDSVGKPKTRDFILKRVTESSIQLDGAIILQHVAADPSVDALPDILARLYARGLTVVTITGLLAP
jgi:peptidoglycan/xylan/chitin deacetylase (PgdA/CDA1 family)